MHPFAFVIFLATGVDETFDSAAFDRASSDPAGSLCRSNRPRCRLVYPEGFENTEVRKYFRTKVRKYYRTSEVMILPEVLLPDVRVVLV